MVVAAVGSFPAVAADETESGILILVFENGLFYDADGDYANGARASWLSGPNEPPDWALGAARWFPLFLEGCTVRTIG